MIAYRWLDRSEWPKAGLTAIEGFRASLPPNARVGVVERDGAIVAAWSFFPRLHAEGLTVLDGAAGARRQVWQSLHDMACEAVMEFDSDHLLTGADREGVRSILVGSNAKALPGDMYVLRMPCRPFIGREE
jgi:hypothetical protein